MKNLLLILILAIGASAQSLDETLKYLNDTLPEVGTIRVSNVMSFTVTPVSFTGCSISYTESYTMNSEDRPFATTKVSIPLKRLTVGSQASEKFKPFWRVDLDAPIQLQSLKFGQLPGAVIEQSHQPLLIKDQASAEKIVKAFTHAAQLCRDQKELF